jgi:serine/threonine protein kinase
MPILLNKYKFDKNDIIGKGGFSTVYQGYNIIDSEKIAIKIDKKIKYNKKESEIYDKIQDEKYMAKKIDYIEKTDKSYLIMPLYDINCEKLMKINKDHYFNEKDILMLAIQIIQQLNNLHKTGLIHQDIKPDNFVFDKENNKFKLIDFGLSKSYIKNDNHIDFERNFSRCGTLRYMSTNCHMKYTLSRRDDLISLSYSLIYLYLKNLPWKNIKTKIKNKTKLNIIIKKLKKEFNDNINTYNLPSPLLLLFNYSNNLRFNSKPDYNFLIKGIYTYLKMNGMKYDGIWTWNKFI